MKNVQYRGKKSKHFARLCTVVMTLRILKTVLPALKPVVPPFVLGGKIVYEINCPHCEVSYVGKTSRRLLRTQKQI